TEGFPVAKKRKKVWPWMLVALVGGFGLGTAYMLRPSDQGETRITITKGSTVNRTLRDLASKGVVHSAELAILMAKINKVTKIKEGVYVIRPHATLSQVFDDLDNVVQVPVRCPEGFWIARTAASLEKQGFCKAKDYLQATYTLKAALPTGANPDPRESGFEGMLLPDTYMLPPKATATDLVSKQLEAFAAKAEPIIGSADTNHILTVASLIELEASDPEERRIIAGIIENRLKKNMRLEIDATVLYAMQEWKVLPSGFVHSVDSAYNTYNHAGLPPGPIGSPSLESIKAAVNPTASDYLFYVSKGHDHHYFAKTYAEHQANINRARAEQGAK
ncbi:MAG: endolytic transglycosylase MltG, partial [Armatimonadota bacterium]